MFPEDAEKREYWWTLDRDGKPVDMTGRVRPEGAPPMVDGSPYTPTFLVDGQLPGVHLHYSGEHIVGIHGCGLRVDLEQALEACLPFEAAIIARCAHQPVDIDLQDAWETVVEPFNEAARSGSD